MTWAVSHQAPLLAKMLHGLRLGNVVTSSANKRPHIAETGPEGPNATYPRRLPGLALAKHGICEAVSKTKNREQQRRENAKQGLVDACTLVPSASLGHGHSSLKRYRAIRLRLNIRCRGLRVHAGVLSRGRRLFGRRGRLFGLLAPARWDKRGIELASFVVGRPWIGFA